MRQARRYHERLDAHLGPDDERTRTHRARHRLDASRPPADDRLAPPRPSLT